MQVKFTNGHQNPVKVQFRKVGKSYSVGGDAGSAVDNDKETFNPFDEVQVEVGATVDLGDVVSYKVVEVTPFSEKTEKSLNDYFEASQRG